MTFTIPIAGSPSDGAGSPTDGFEMSVLFKTDELNYLYDTVIRKSYRPIRNVSFVSKPTN